MPLGNEALAVTEAVTNHQSSLQDSHFPLAFPALKRRANIGRRFRGLTTQQCSANCETVPFLVLTSAELSAPYARLGTKNEWPEVSSACVARPRIRTWIEQAIALA